MRKYYVLQRNFFTAKAADQFEFDTIHAHSQERAWEKVENSIMNTNSQAWVMTYTELKALKQIIEEV